MLQTVSASAFSNKIGHIQRAFVLALLLVGAADYLFYGHPIGISAAIYALLLATAVTLINPHRPSLRNWLASIGILAVCLLPIIEHFGALSLLIGLVGVSTYALIAFGQFSGDLQDRAVKLAWQLVGGPVRFGRDLSRLLWLQQRRNTEAFGRRKLINWAVPVVLSLVFLLLFRSANPVIESWLHEINLRKLIEAFEAARVLFWIVCLSLVWSFVRVYRHRNWAWLGETASEALQVLPDSSADGIFGVEAVVRSLVLFNALFAVQSALDITYLWGGLQLPVGMTYADYARRGAYPLIATALLAAVFVLIAIRPGSAGEHSPLCRGLVLLWTAQNVLLVISSIQRLQLYVEAYSLTYWRVAALVWMGLVAAGLILIFARIVWRKSNQWLIRTNTALLAATLYGCSLFNFPSFIATYNIKHSYAVTGKGAILDIEYLCRLGPYAIRAIRESFPSNHTLPTYYWRELGSCTTEHAALLHKRMQDWRAWSFRGWRMQRYLTAQSDD